MAYLDIISGDAQPIIRRRDRETRPPGVVRCLAPGEAFYREGDPADREFDLLDGMVRLVRFSGDGGRQVIGFACPGERIGAPLADRHAHTAEAVTRCRAVSVGGAFEREDPERLREALRRTTARLERAESQILLMGRLCALERVAGFILMMASRLAGADEHDPPAFELPMDRRDMADFLGLTVETVSRKLTALREGGIIDLPTPRQVRVLSWPGLRRCAGGVASGL
ncbi:helix-turn-helix domain-containing protein [Marinicauda salina]|nr:helix-turn-helix domain-containing protein [Marinicauda salina]